MVSFVVFYGWKRAFLPWHSTEPLSHNTMGEVTERLCVFAHTVRTPNQQLCSHEANLTSPQPMAHSLLFVIFIAALTCHTATLIVISH